MKSSEIRRRFLAFFAARGHAIIPSAPLVPENDPSVLFNTAGMQPLVPYLLGEKHPQGTRLVNFQKCVRTVDINDIGDNTHATFFEMMGNWSLGDYFKKEAIEWSYELLTDKEEGFGLDPRRLYVTCFEGDEKAPRDDESAGLWKEVFKKHAVVGERIFFMPAKHNWWSPGDNGPCGPDTEMFYDVTGALTNGLTAEEFNVEESKQHVVEIWNDVFMEYMSKDGKVIGKLEHKNVDTGAGFERVTMVLQEKNNIFDTDIFTPIISKMDEFISDTVTEADPLQVIRAKRIIADHTRAAVMLVSDGVLPSNTDQGYILRRLLRRAVRFADTLGLKHRSLFWLADTIVDQYKDIYPHVGKQKETIKVTIDKEEHKFRNTLSHGLKEFERCVKNETHEDGRDGLSVLTAKDAFVLFSTYGFPIEMTEEIARERGITVDRTGFNEEMKKHQDLSRAGAEQKFKGGLGDTSEQSVKYHTATHLLHQALREVLGAHVSQKGSNITSERLRFDFSHIAKMTDDEKIRVEHIVNEKIQAALPVNVVSMPIADAEKTGAVHFFGEKYGDTVTVYYIGTDIEQAFSKEFCGGPHVKNTSELGHFKIQKEEAVAQGVRRIKAILE